MNRQSSAAGTRIGGLDAARALAVIGMLMVHVGPREGETPAGILYNLPHGRASILFIAGTGVALLSGRAGSQGVACLRLVWMALAFLPLGLVLQRLDHGVAVILHHYAAFYLAGALLLAVPRRALLAIAVIWTLAGPVLYLMARSRWADIIARESAMAGDGFAEILSGLLLSGPYPLVTWGAALAWGMWVGRLNLRAETVRKGLVLVGIAAALIAAAVAGLLGPVADGAGNARHLLDGTPHSQMPLWLIGSIGSALAVTGVMLMAVERWPGVLAPLVALGQLALSFYVGHLLLLHWFGDIVGRDSVGEAMISVLLVSGAAVALAFFWRRHFPRGPLEALLVWPFRPVLTRRLPRNGEPGGI